MNRYFRILCFISLGYSILSTIQCAHMAARYDYAQHSLVQGSEVMTTMVEDFSTYRDTVTKMTVLEAKSNIIYKTRIIYIKVPETPMVKEPVKSSALDTFPLAPMDSLIIVQ